MKAVGIILVGLFALAVLMRQGGGDLPPPKSYREYPEITVTGFMTFNEWQLAYGGGSMLDYEDWLKGF